MGVSCFCKHRTMWSTKCIETGNFQQALWTHCCGKIIWLVFASVMTNYFCKSASGGGGRNPPLLRSLAPPTFFSMAMKSRHILQKIPGEGPPRWGGCTLIYLLRQTAPPTFLRPPPTLKVADNPVSGVHVLHEVHSEQLYVPSKFWAPYILKNIRTYLSK